MAGIEAANGVYGNSYKQKHAPNESKLNAESKKIKVPTRSSLLDMLFLIHLDQTKFMIIP